MVFTPKDNLIKKLKANGFKQENSPAGITVFIKQMEKKIIIYTLRQSIFEKSTVQLDRDGAIRSTYKYNEVELIKIL